MFEFKGKFCGRRPLTLPPLSASACSFPVRRTYFTEAPLYYPMFHLCYSVQCSLGIPSEHCIVLLWFVSGECLTGPAVKRPLIALLVTACVFVAAMIAIVSMLYRKKVRECCGRQPINRYSYMMNSDDDDSSIQIKNDEEEILHSSWETCDVGDL